MMVVGIIGLVMAIGIPAFVQTTRKDPMRQAVSDLVEACSNARACAILNGAATEIQFAVKQGSFKVVTGAAAQKPGDPDARLNTKPPEVGKSTSSVPAFSGQLSESLVVEMLDVNFKEHKDEEHARVRFFPNGTTDEFTIVLRWPEKNQYRKITLDIITGQADMDVIR